MAEIQNCSTFNNITVRTLPIDYFTNKNIILQPSTTAHIIWISTTNGAVYLPVPFSSFSSHKDLFWLYYLPCGIKEIPIKLRFWVPDRLPPGSFLCLIIEFEISYFSVFPLFEFLDKFCQWGQLFIFNKIELINKIYEMLERCVQMRFSLECHYVREVWMVNVRVYPKQSFEYDLYDLFKILGERDAYQKD